MINNRQNGRRRGRSGNAPRPNGDGQPDRGSRLDNRARGNASQLHKKYKTLAADAQRQGDRVMTEYYLQFADHYFRVLSENRSRFEDQQQRRDRFDANADDYDGDDGEQAEGFDERPAERGPRAQEWERGEADGNRDNGRERRDGNRSDGNRADGNRFDARDAGRGEGQQRGLEGPRADAGRERQERGEEREYRQPRQPREGGDQRPQRQRRPERQDIEPARVAQPAAEPVMDLPAPTPISVEVTPVSPVEAPAVPVAAELPLDAPVPERRPRGRPRKVVAAAPAEEAERIDMDRLPPALSAEPAGADAPAGEPKPRRTRRPRGEAATV